MILIAVQNYILYLSLQVFELSGLQELYKSILILEFTLLREN